MENTTFQKAVKLLIDEGDLDPEAKFTVWLCEDGFYQPYESFETRTAKRISMTALHYATAIDPKQIRSKRRPLELFQNSYSARRVQATEAYLEMKDWHVDAQSYEDLLKIPEMLYDLKAKGFSFDERIIMTKRRIVEEVCKVISENRSVIENQLIKALVLKPGAKRIGEIWENIDDISASLERFQDELIEESLRSPRRIIISSRLDGQYWTDNEIWLVERMYSKTRSIIVLPTIFKAVPWISRTEKLVLEDTPSEELLETTQRLIDDGGMYRDFKSAYQAAVHL